MPGSSLRNLVGTLGWRYVDSARRALQQVSRLEPVSISNTRWIAQMPNVESNGDESSVVISEAAAQKLIELKNETVRENGTMLRVAVDAGGCSGFQYSFTFDQETREGDHVFKRDGASVVVDDLSLEFLKGSTIDYTEELIRASFQITNNPNAESGCGCGASFVAK
mmetsp:Transcript_5312/g.7189  ORF Transcript_5312/g.7189 Transcript_5312/m.7189 type:complete len:166 (+) Transcript_5312:97-594(+)|eukprot:CAMPEP_0196583850 /NCGR_PEP_ID=MMETSP1081-20130531/44948_1 /TAXON_ID=36882 /ORGANISM="Pyramimonas amylifera, Strain CCMP720" /LENGTH=165 /DNA_ID=CAMNT_0041904871 /DNA_START=87 /DNA_END=584 /DNA_ORIENTATION=+